MSRQLCLTLAVVSAAGLLAACETDDSLPTHPRTANFLTPDSNAQQNAKRNCTGKAFPGTPGGRSRNSRAICHGSRRPEG